MFKILNKSGNSPFYATDDAAGFDIASNEDLTLFPGEIKAVATGLFCDLEYNSAHARRQLETTKGMDIDVVAELQIRPRSGLVAKQGISVANAPGTVDFSYPGEIKVLLINLSMQDFVITKGMRIAQGIIALTCRARGVRISEKERTGGFGSTGT